MISRWLLKIKLIAIATIVIVIALNYNILKAASGLDVQEFRSSDVGAVRPLGSTSESVPLRLTATRGLSSVCSSGATLARFPRLRNAHQESRGTLSAVAHGGNPPFGFNSLRREASPLGLKSGNPTTTTVSQDRAASPPQLSHEPPLQKFRSWQDYANSISLTEKSIDNNLLPLAKVHPLPTSLAKWEDKNNQKDYFTQIKPTPLGYLIWSQFPVKIYVAKPTLSPDNSASSIRQQQWIETVRKAIAEWSMYLPLQETDNPELADITIARSTPERKVKFNPATGLYDIPRAITAQTSYQFYWQDSKILSHRMTLKVSPSLSQPAILAATRHELGHALGIWGHSPDQNDALYFSQVRDFPPISARDINTLKKIYQQPTKLGW